MTAGDDAIFKNLQNGSEMEGCVFHKIPMSATIYRRLKDVGGGPNLHNVMALPGIFGVVVQMTPRTYGEAKNLLMAALSRSTSIPKIAIAVDADVDIFNPPGAPLGALHARQSGPGRRRHSRARTTTPWMRACPSSARPARGCGSGSAPRC